MITPRCTGTCFLVVTLACGLAGRAFAQQSVSASTSNESDTEPVRLPAFDVQANSDRGYGATQSISGSRINVPIQDLAATLVTITPRLMQDINPQEPSDAA